MKHHRELPPNHTRLAPVALLSILACACLMVELDAARRHVFPPQPGLAGVIITRVSVDPAVPQAAVTLLNTLSEPVTAITLALTTTYLDGTRGSSGFAADYYASLLMDDRSLPESLRVIRPNEATTVTVPIPAKPSSAVVDVDVTVKAVVMFDRTASGDRAEVERIFAARDRRREQLGLRLAQLEQIAKGTHGEDTLRHLAEALDAEAATTELDPIGREIRGNLQNPPARHARSGRSGREPAGPAAPSVRARA
jgi:hypothetical protein